MSSSTSPSFWSSCRTLGANPDGVFVLFRLAINPQTEEGALGLVSPRHSSLIESPANSFYYLVHAVVPAYPQSITDQVPSS